MENPFKKGELEKLTIYAYTAADYSGAPVDSMKVSFNPEEYTRVYDVEYEREQGAGTTGNPGVFRRIKPQEFMFRFLFDGTGASGEKVDITETVQKFFSLVGYDGEIHRPRFLKIIWGTLDSNCVLTRADINYKLFKRDGTPLRAVINASFSENMDDATRVRTAQDSSPDLTHVRIAKEGDTLPLMAYAIYGDHNYYMEVARVNRLNNFRSLQPGQKIFFPPVDKTKR